MRWSVPPGGPNGGRAPAPAPPGFPGSARRAKPTKCIGRLAGALANDDRVAALLLAPEAPYPLAGGGSLRTASLLEYLGRHYALDLIVFRQPGAAEPASLLPAGLVRQVTVIPLPASRPGTDARRSRN